jgi:hypothetical protein
MGAYPNKYDFEKYDAQILVSRILTCHALKDNDNVSMVHLFEMGAIIRENNVHTFDTHFKEMICKIINDIPEDCWQKVVKGLHFKQFANH